MDKDDKLVSTLFIKLNYRQHEKLMISKRIKQNYRQHEELGERREWHPTDLEHLERFRKLVQS